jgi:hypothetical protein
MRGGTHVGGIGARNAVEGDSAVHLGILRGQQRQRATHAEPYNSNLGTHNRLMLSTMHLFSTCTAWPGLAQAG